MSAPTTDDAADGTRRGDGVAGDVALTVDRLRVAFASPGGWTAAVRGVSLTVRRGEVVGVVGESGSGKSATALALLGLLPAGARVSGSVRLAANGPDRPAAELVGVSDRVGATLRGRRISMVFQDPLTAFTPVYPVGAALVEAVRAHQDLSRTEARQRAVELLALVGIADPDRAARAYPHEFSGGMRQRAMIALAIANEPDVIVADEPTTALDVTVQAQVLDVLRRVRRRTGAALVLISHDLGVIAGLADRVEVMYAGRVVESGPTAEVFARPTMPYTLGLLGAAPRLDARPGSRLAPMPGHPPVPGALAGGCPFRPRCPLAVAECAASEPEPRGYPPTAAGGAAHTVACHRAERVRRWRPTPAQLFAPTPAEDRPEGEPRPAPGGGEGEAAPEPGPSEHGPPGPGPLALEVVGLGASFPVFAGAVFRRRVGVVHAVDGVDLRVRAGETLGLVGESGAGKSTTLRAILGLQPPQVGDVRIFGVSVRDQSRAGRQALRGLAQIVFQDPSASLDPRMTVHDVIAEPLRALGRSGPLAPRVSELLRMVGMGARHAGRFPHELSGGERQRVAIARALAVQPRLLVLDEPVSSLDVSIQAGILNLLIDLRRQLALSYLFVSHDLSVVRHVAHRVAVMCRGRIVEAGAASAVYDRPRHPYTRALLSAIPVPDPARERGRQRVLLAGDPPSPTTRPIGCGFRSRCPTYAGLGVADRRRCEQEAPPPLPHGPDHVAACHHPHQ